MRVTDTNIPTAGPRTTDSGQFIVVVFVGQLQLEVLGDLIVAIFRLRRVVDAGAVGKDDAELKASRPTHLADILSR